MLLFVNLVVVVMVVFFALAISSSGKAAETKVAVDAPPETKKNIAETMVTER